MSKLLSNYDLMNKVIAEGHELGIIQLKSEGETYDGRTIVVNGKPLLYFGNCSYLGLDTSDELKQGIIETTLKYGSCFSSSRFNVELSLYEQLESLLEEIMGHPCLVSQTTTLGHQSVFPILIQPDDLIIMDHQVHASVQNAVKMVAALGTKTIFIRHNNMQALEEKVIEAQGKFKNIWYLADGIYSMYGDGAPIPEMKALMDKYDNLYSYVDDAHGISWIGKNGRGYILDSGPLHPKMVFSTSMAKGYGAGGGILVFPTNEMKQTIRNLGSSLFFSGPVSTPVLGACIASAKLHLNGEIERRQQELYARMKFFREKATLYKIPIINKNFSPIFYIGFGSLEAASGITKDLQNSGYSVIVCTYPGVSYKHSGIRVAITTHLSFDDIDKFTQALAFLVNEYEAQGLIKRDKIKSAFKLDFV